MVKFPHGNCNKKKKDANEETVHFVIIGLGTHCFLNELWLRVACLNFSISNQHHFAYMIK